MSEKHLVCQGALCRCNFGTAPDKLKVLTQSQRYINDKEGGQKLIATNKDIGKTFEKNMFGNCAKLNNNPCQVTVTEWKGFYKKITLEENQGNALLEDSTATCPVGAPDCISIINHGQTAEVSQKSVKNANEEVLAEFFPFVNLNEKVKKYLPIN